MFCEGIQPQQGISPRIDGLKGDLLGRAHRFISEHLQLEPPGDLWRWLLDLARVRDCVVRCAGNVDLCDPATGRELAAVAKRRPGIGICDDHLLFESTPHFTSQPKQVLHIESSFCLEAVTAALGLFGYLYQHRDSESL